MKKIALGLIALLIALMPAMGNTGGEITLISGQVNSPKATTVILFEVIEGRKVEFASTKLGADHSFAFAVPVLKEGLYYLADQNRQRFTRIYLKQGDKLDLRLNENGYELMKGSEENQLLHKWFSASFVITEPAFNWMRDTCTYLSFFPKINAFAPTVPAFKAGINTKNKKFNELMKLVVDTDTEHAAMYFLLTPNTIHPKGPEEYPPFYQSIVQKPKYTTAAVLELGEGADLPSRYAMFAMMAGKEKYDKDNHLQNTLNRFGNDTIKGLYLSQILGRMRTYEDVEKTVAPFRQFLVTDSMKAAYFNALKSVAGFKKGNPAFNFAYEDVSGKKVTLEGMKGKVVLIDVWATWCGPCKAEIPHLKKLEAEMKNSQVEFVSISVDEEKDKEKWKNMIAKDELGGTQLFAKGWSEITKYYEIKGIPRFLLIDQQGKIVSADAPRPSSPELKQLIETTLKGL